MSKAEAFFFTHAGWSYNPATETKRAGRLRGARELASAEAWARDMGVTYRWEWDQDAGSVLSILSEAEQAEPHEVLGCILDLPRDKDAASLWGIIDPSREYGRVVEAELAYETRAAIMAALLEAI